MVGGLNSSIARQHSSRASRRRSRVCLLRTHCPRLARAAFCRSPEDQPYRRIYRTVIGSSPDQRGLRRRNAQGHRAGSAESGPEREGARGVVERLWAPTVGSSQGVRACPTGGLPAPTGPGACRPERLCGQAHVEDLGGFADGAGPEVAVGLEADVEALVAHRRRGRLVPPPAWEHGRPRHGPFPPATGVRRRPPALHEGRRQAGSRPAVPAAGRAARYVPLRDAAARHAVARA